MLSDLQKIHWALAFSSSTSATIPCSLFSTINNLLPIWWQQLLQGCFLFAVQCTFRPQKKFLPLKQIVPINVLALKTLDFVVNVLHVEQNPDDKSSFSSSPFSSFSSVYLPLTFVNLFVWSYNKYWRMGDTSS